jgi:hypothetical protein
MKAIWDGFLDVIMNPEQHSAMFGFFVAVLLPIVGFVFNAIKRLYLHYIAENSARKTGMESYGNRSDLHFSRSGALIGRKKELKQLKNFCRRRPRCYPFSSWYDITDNKRQPFLFWIVSGEEGSGKSKLCYEFLLRMSHRGWTVCQPQKSEEALNEASEHIPKKTLYMLDYAEYDTKAITEWLIKLGKGHRGCKKERRIGRRVRVLLIQRRMNEGGSFNDGRINPYRHKPSDKDDHLTMGKMSEKHLKHLVKHSAKQYFSRKKKDNRKQKIQHADLHRLSKFDIQIVYETLVKVVDPPKDNKRIGHAPLYAIILAQAGVDRVKIESEEAALEYVVHTHEEIRYENLLRKLCERPNNASVNSIQYSENLFSSVMTLLAIATMTRRWELSNDNIEMIPSFYYDTVLSFIKTYKPSADKKSPEFEIELFDWDNGIKNIIVKSLEPDKIGGYFVCRWLKNNSFAQEIVSTAWNDIRQVTQFVRRLFQDFDGQSWLVAVEPLFKKVQLPHTLKTIPKHAFLNYQYLDEIIIPGSVEVIEYEAFLNCKELVQVVVQDGVKTIKQAAFSGCGLLRSVILPPSILEIADGAFEHLDREECKFPNYISKDDWFVESEYPRQFGGVKWKRLSDIVEEEDSNGNKTGRRFRLLIAKYITYKIKYDSLSDEQLIAHGGHIYAESYVRNYLLGDFKKKLHDTEGNAPEFWTSSDIHNGDQIWLMSSEQFRKYFPSGNKVTTASNAPFAWWLSDTQENNKRALFVTEEGAIHRAQWRDDHDGLWVSDECGLRPAFWLIED